MVLSIASVVCEGSLELAERMVPALAESNDKEPKIRAIAKAANTYVRIDKVRLLRMLMSRVANGSRT
jgi:hypothetical protein